MSKDTRWAIYLQQGQIGWVEAPTFEKATLIAVQVLTKLGYTPQFIILKQASSSDLINSRRSHSEQKERR